MWNSYKKAILRETNRFGKVSTHKKGRRREVSANIGSGFDKKALVIVVGIFAFAFAIRLHSHPISP